MDRTVSGNLINLITMSNKCCKCSEVILEEDPYTKCDMCHKYLHTVCMNFTASEIKCVELKKGRTLKIVCPKCLDNRTEASHLLNLVIQMRKEIDEMKEMIRQSSAREMNCIQVPNNEAQSPGLVDVCGLIREEIGVLKNDVRAIRESNVDLIKLLYENPNNGAQMGGEFKAQYEHGLDDGISSNAGATTSINVGKDDTVHIFNNVGIEMDKVNFDREIQRLDKWTDPIGDKYGDSCQKSVKRDIYYFSDQQGTEMISELSDYYSEIDIIEYIKPGSTLKEIYNAILLAKNKFKKGDIIILHAGANDDDPNIANFFTMRIASELHGLTVCVLPITGNRIMNEDCLNKMIQINLKSLQKEGTEIVYIEREADRNLLNSVIFTLDCVCYNRRYITGIGNAATYTNEKKKHSKAHQMTIEECFRKQFFRARGNK